MSLAYHFAEFEIALDRSDPRRSGPVFEPRHKTILDVGCGMGQTLLSASLDSDVQAFGVDIDEEAIKEGARRATANIHLQVASGDRLLCFSSDFFDLAYARVALPLLPIKRSLAEMARVLKPGGDLWLSMHTFGMNTRWLWQSMRALDFKKVAGRTFVIANGLLFHCTGRQMTISGRCESFQTRRGIRIALEAAGFTDIRFDKGRHFVVQARKEATISSFSLPSEQLREQSQEILATGGPR